MKKANRAIAMLLGAACAASVFAGCGNSSDGGETGGGTQTHDGELEHMEISVAWWDADTCLAGDPILDRVEEKFNVEFIPMNVTWDDYVTKEQLWASTDSLPDIFAADFRNTSTFTQWARDGVIRSIPKDLSAYPNLQKYLSGSAASSCMVDDEMFCIFRQTYGEQYGTVSDRYIVYRWDLAQEAGITEKPTDWKSFREMILAIMKADPEKKNIGGMTAQSAGMFVGPMFCYSMPNAVVSGATFKWVDQNGTYVPAYFAGETMGADALPTWNLMRDMYQEGTIDHDIALSTLEQAQNKFLNGQAAAICTTYGPMVTLDDVWEEINGSTMEEDVAVMPLMPGVDGEKYYWAWDYAWSESMFSSNVDDAKMERILMIYDYLLSDEGVIECKYGVEGETYQIVDGNLELIEGVDINARYPSLQFLGTLVAWAPELPNGYTAPRTEPDWWVEMDNDYVEQAKACVLPESNPKCTSEFIALGTDFGLKINDDALNIMTGDRPVEQMWSEIIEEYKMDGLEDYIKQVNEAVKE